MQDDRGVHRLHRARIFQEAGSIVPRRNRAGFLPFAVELVADFPLLDVVALHLVRVAHPGGRLLRSARSRIHADNRLRIRERLDVLHEFFEVPLDIGPVRASLVAVARRHRVELVVVALEQIGLTAIELHFANLHALARQVARLEAYRHVARAQLLELVLGRLRVHAHHGFHLEPVFKSLVHARVFGIVAVPVRELEGLRTQAAPVNLQGVEVHLLGELYHHPGRVHGVEDFAPPHRLHLAVGEVAPADKAVVVLRRAAVNRLAQKAARPLVRIGRPEAGAVVAADAVPVVIVRKASIREAEQRIAAVHQRLRHVVVAAGRIPDGKVGSHHVFLVDDDARMQVIDHHRILRSKYSSNTSERRYRTREQRGNIHKNLSQ